MLGEQRRGDVTNYRAIVSIWQAVTERGHHVEFVPGEVLVHHGAGGDHCYAIESGELLVTTSSRQGATVVIARRGPGDVVGELAALSGMPRTATVTAHTPVTATRLSSVEYESMLQAEPELALVAAKRLAHQLRELTERYAVRGEELQTRILTLLEMNRSISGDPVFRSTREELAGWVGATREAVSRSLRDLEMMNRVRLHRGSVELST